MREDAAAWRHGRGLCGDFFNWYNAEHHHVGLGLFTPHDVHYGLAAAKREQRARVLAEAFALRPERFPNGRPSPRPLPTAVWINPPKAPIDGEEIVNAMTPEPDPVTIGAVRSCLEGDFEHERPGVLNLTPEDFLRSRLARLSSTLDHIP